MANKAYYSFTKRLSSRHTKLLIDSLEKPVSDSFNIQWVETKFNCYKDQVLGLYLHTTCPPQRYQITEFGLVSQTVLQSLRHTAVLLGYSIYLSSASSLVDYNGTCRNFSHIYKFLSCLEQEHLEPFFQI